METATLGGGCFWCLEAVFQEIEGVLEVRSGYMGGRVANPTYEQVCSGRTGHIEVVQLTFDPFATSYRDILEVFFNVHDPTTRDRQGNDVGPQYRSVIFCHNEDQRRIAEQIVNSDPEIVTEVRAAGPFYVAENYHQRYFESNAHQPYCLFVVAPKVRKFREKFAGKLKHTAVK